MAGWVEHASPCDMVRCANRSETAKRVIKGSTPCVTHHFPSADHAAHGARPRTLRFMNNPEARPNRCCQAASCSIAREGKSLQERPGSYGFRGCFCQVGFATRFSSSSHVLAGRSGHCRPARGHIEGPERQPLVPSVLPRGRRRVAAGGAAGSRACECHTGRSDRRLDLLVANRHVGFYGRLLRPFSPHGIGHARRSEPRDRIADCPGRDAADSDRTNTWVA